MAQAFSRLRRDTGAMEDCSWSWNFCSLSLAMFAKFASFRFLRVQHGGATGFDSLRQSLAEFVSGLTQLQGLLTQGTEGGDVRSVGFGGRRHTPTISAG